MHVQTLNRTHIYIRSHTLPLREEYECFSGQMQLKLALYWNMPPLPFFSFQQWPFMNGTSIGICHRSHSEGPHKARNCRKGTGPGNREWGLASKHFRIVYAVMHAHLPACMGMCMQLQAVKVERIHLIQLGSWCLRNCFQWPFLKDQTGVISATNFNHILEGLFQIITFPTLLSTTPFHANQLKQILGWTLLVALAIAVYTSLEERLLEQ